MMDWIAEQASWVRHTDLPSNYFPGVILMAVVGGSSLVAATALAKRSDGWQLASKQLRSREARSTIVHMPVPTHSIGHALKS
ncbi:MAG: hypothetical protein QOF53_2441 [Nocardioidaceae bacterium]|jgi:hypothetical protein|nr:hypothetical protein [Nocardioidaceae bacterium]